MTASLTPQELRVSRRRRTRGHVIVVTTLAVMTFGLWAASLMIGETFHTPDEVLRVILGETVPGASFSVGELRLPRATLGLLAGLAYGAAGVSFQTLLRNQLASPDIIGISAGASAAGVLGIVLLGWSQPQVSALALVAALGTAVAIYLLSFRGGFAGTRLILIGIGVSSMLGSVVSWVLSKANQWDLGTATRWLTGSLNGATWEQVAPLALVCVLVLPVMWTASSQLATLRFSDETAIALGVRVGWLRIGTIVAAVALVAVATASCGPIAFVAFMAGPIAMRLSPSAPSLLLPASLVGAVIVLASDLAGQYLLGTRYPVGVITGALGAPFLIHLLVRSGGVRPS